jgi:hypothetical protein
VSKPDPNYANLEFVNDAERIFFEEARLGLATIEFIRSDVGRYLHGCAKQQAEEARDKILTLNPYVQEDQAEIAKAQADAACGQAFMRWCSDLIQAGNMAEQSLQEYDNG